MNDGGRNIVAGLVPRGTFERLETYVALLRAGAARQNLIAPSTMDEIWTRHILDSLQLLDPADGTDGDWVDIGSGAGLPGLVVAIAGQCPTVLIEPRRLRAAFLSDCVDSLGLGRQVRVLAGRCEQYAPATPAGTISARAVAPLSRLLEMAEHFAGIETRWLLPKGRGAAAEVAETRRTWQGEFRLVPSLTESSSSIVEARQVRRKGRQ